MYTSKKIKEILKEMLTNGESEKIIKCKGYSSKERKLAKDFFDLIKKQDKIEDISIQELLFIMPRAVMMNVIACLIPYKLEEVKDKN